MLLEDSGRSGDKEARNRYDRSVECSKGSLSLDVGGVLKRPGTVAIVGVGLIGGSIGLAIRARGAADRVVGIDLDPVRLDQASRLGAIDFAAPDLATGVAEADIAVVCAPVTATVPLVLDATRFGPESILIIDVGSTKARIVEAVEADVQARNRFVGCHPIAGSERRGVEHSRADLFDGRTCALTPTDRTPVERIERARSFWTTLGATVVEVDPIVHDHQLALTSHLPHAVASALASTVSPELFSMAAGAYRDGTRVADADASLWSGIFLDNRRSLLEALSAFEAELKAFREALEAGNQEQLASWWSRGRVCRALYVDPGEQPSKPPGPN